MEQLWFVTESVWTAQNVASDAVKRAQLSLAFEGRILDWYMGYIGQHANSTVEEVKNALKQQFKKPKSYSKMVVDLKDFKQGPSESMWEANQQLKKVIREGGFQYDDIQHTKSFIVMLLPHLHVPMGHQTFESPDKALEVTMKLFGSCAQR